MRRTTGLPYSAAAAPQLLRRWAGDAIFERGQEDIEAGRIESASLESEDDGSWRAVGVVRGPDAETFRVAVGYVPSRGFDSDCSCPYGYRCRHAVALVLNLENKEQPSSQGSQWQLALGALLPPPPAATAGQSALVLSAALAPSPQHPAFPWPQSVWISAARGRIRQDGVPGALRGLRLGARRSGTPANAEDMLLELLARLDPAGALKSTGQTAPDAVPIPAVALGTVLTLLQQQPFAYGPDGQPIRLATHSLRLVIDTGDTPDGGCEVRARWLRGEQPVEFAEPVVLGDWIYADGLFHPVAEAINAAVVGLLTRPAVVPATEMGEFSSRYLPKLVQAGKVHSTTHSPPQILTDVAPIPQLHLQEQSGALVASLTVTYGPDAVADPSDGQELLPWPGGGWVRRQPELEQQCVKRLDALDWEARAASSWVATGETALELVATAIPRLLSEGWEVFGAQSLPSYKVSQRRARVKAQVRSGIDWFELDQQVTIGDEVVDRQQLLQALRRRQVWVKLGSGEHARLPESWLLAQQHASDILAVDADTTLRVPKYHAGMLSELLSDADETDVESEWESFWSRLQGLDGIPVQDVPTGFSGVLRPYQQSGYDYLCFLRDHGLHGILADDMGLGKTIQALALLTAEHEAGRRGPTLLVAPTSVVSNWAAEAGRFAPGLDVGIWAGKDRHDHWEIMRRKEVLVTSYALVWRDLQLLQQQDWHYVILDEAQMVKNPGSQTARAVRRLRARHRLALTGTPIENNLMELWSLFAFLLPGLLGSEGAFRRQFEQPIANGDHDRLATLRRRVGPFILRRLKDDVATDLPPRTEVPLLIDLLPAQRRFYETVLASCRQEVMASVAEKGWQRSQITAIEALLRLRQVCCDPRLLSMADAQKLPSAKLQAFSELIEEVIAEGHRILVFSQFVKMLHLIRQHLDTAGIPYFYLDGQTKDRQSLVDQFNAGDVPLFLISLKAGGTGLNLTGADYVIHFDPWWNPAAEDQATDRSHRIGQTRPVFAYKLIARDTIEEKIIALQAKKRRLVDGLLQAEIGAKQLTADDLAYLFEPSAAALELE